ncbi:MAG: hypothetical protein PVJ57_17010 [Phycisphaerae bacterium]
MRPMKSFLTILALSSMMLLVVPTLAGDLPSDIERLAADKIPHVKAPAKIAGDQQPLRIKVLVLDFNPWIPGKLHSPDDPNAAPKGLREVGGWNDPLPLVTGYMQDLCDASGGYVQFEIADWLVVRRFQQKTDGFMYTPETYMEALRQGVFKAESWHKPDGIDYPHMCKEFDVYKRVESGEIDEVWMLGLPYFGYWESCMVGKGAFEVNGGVYGDVPCQRRFVVMGFNMERGVAEMIHDLCHRTEATMSRVYGGWEVDKLTSNWARFAANQTQSGTAAVGTCHYPPNAERDYDYANKTAVTSTADDWLTYPELTGRQREFSCEEWKSPYKDRDGNPDYHRNYMNWWFTHLPKAPGVNADGRLNNWWEYVFNFNAFDERGKPLPDAEPAKDAKTQKDGLRRPA